MAKYLVVAHQTATSPTLISKLREIAANDASARFTLVVPVTRVEHLLTWTEGEAKAVAERTAAEAKELMERYDVRVDACSVGDESPLQAISDALADGGTYEAIVISTLAPGVSRWLKLDVHNRARQKFQVPIISVIAPLEPAADPARR